MQSNSILQIENLTTEFRSGGETTKAVDGIELHLDKGEILGLVGESGSGKSVTSLSVMRLIASPPGRIADGHIWFRADAEAEPIDLLRLSSNQMRDIRGNRIAMIFQEPMTSLNPVLTCGYQVDEVLKLHLGMDDKSARKRTLEWFERVKLPDPQRMYKSYPHQLSGGQKQRVMIAMGLACEPDILIADEPTTALDVTVQKAIMELLKELQREVGMAILFITHDLGVIADLTDRVVVMYQGKIVEQGMVEQIFKDPQHPYTRGLLACRPPLKYRLRRLPVVRDFMATSTNGVVESTGLTVEESLQRNAFKQNDWEARKSGVKQNPVVLEVRDLITRFVSKKSFLGSPKTYVNAVDGVTFHVRKGETLGLVGESGCGKTTLGRSIMQLIASSSGEILYRGKNLSQLKRGEVKEFRKQMQMVFQDPYASLNPRMTIGTAIREPMRVHGLHGSGAQRKDKVVELLEIVGLSASHYGRYPHEFSGGQRQRICIARALAVEPEFLVCDESVSALDVSVQAQVLNLLVELREQFQLTMIFISHDLSVVRFLADRILVMQNGKVVESGDTDRIFNKPEQTYTKTLLQAIPGANQVQTP